MYDGPREIRTVHSYDHGRELNLKGSSRGSRVQRFQLTHVSLRDSGLFSTKMVCVAER